MRNPYIFGFVAIFFTGCASAPPTLTSVAPETTALNVPSESAPAIEKPGQTVARPKPTGTEADARRHFLRGMAALETAKTKADLALAIEEFNLATGISPKMAEAWLNLGKAQVQHGLYADAMESYRQYLKVAPDAPDAQTMQDEIVKLEFRQERLEKSQGREGEWMDNDGSRYYLTVSGNRLTLKALEYVPKIDAAPGSDPILDESVPVEYQLFLQGDQLSGKWSRAELTVNTCPVPKDEADVTGEIIDSEGKMVLRHERTRFTTVTSSFLGLNPICKSVGKSGRPVETVSIHGPVKKGGLGVAVAGFSRWDGGIFPDIGWRGRLKLGPVPPGCPAYEAGLRAGDEIMVIDGAAVKSLSAGQARLLLSGEIGTPVTLEIWRRGSKNTTIIKMNRVEEIKQ